MVGPEFSLFGGFTGLEGNIGCQMLGGGGAAAPPAPLAPVPLVGGSREVQGFS